MPLGTFTDDELLAYMDEMLPEERASQLEQLLRQPGELQQRMALLLRRRDQGGHTVGEIWRRHRLSCLSRSDLGGLLLGTLDDEQTAYAEFHLQTVGCRVCAANLQDLREAQPDAGTVQQRRRKFFESSAGQLRRAD